MSEFWVYTYIVLWLFFLYGFAGVLVEMFYCWVAEFKGVIESRTGLLYLPINPLSGLGGVVISLVLIPWIDNPIAVFFVGALVGSVLEFVASWVMEKAFGAVYWDYSDEFLNIQGRICLKYAAFWGLLSLVLLYVLDVLNLIFIVRVVGEAGLPILAVLLVLFVLSVALTLATFTRVGQRNRVLKAAQQGEVLVLPNPWWARVVDRLVPDQVLVNTFPRMSIVTEYQALTGVERALIFWLPRIGKQTAGREKSRTDELRAHAIATMHDTGGGAKSTVPAADAVAAAPAN